MPRSSPRIFLLAGEVSGDGHGADLSGELLKQAPHLWLEGIGGPRMAASGVRIIEDSTAWGVVGWAEAARHLPVFLRRLAAITARLLADPPDLLVLIDFPGFNLEVLKRTKGRMRTVYYVPPMVSVRRGRRAARVASLGARLLAIFPFEAEAYRRAGADVVFVGHPAVDLRTRAEPVEAVRRRIGIPRDAPLIGLLPGSRWQELQNLLGPMLGAAARIRAQAPPTVFLLALASPTFRQAIDAAAAASGVPVIVLNGARDVMLASDVLLTASGTATVEAMILGVPMVVAYRGSWLSYGFAHIALTTRWAAIPNIMAQEAIVPELLQGRATSEGMSAAVLALLRDDGARRTMRDRLRLLAEGLGAPGAPARAAAEVLAAAGVVPLKRPAALQ